MIELIGSTWSQLIAAMLAMLVNAGFGYHNNGVFCPGCLAQSTFQQDVMIYAYHKTDQVA